MSDQVTEESIAIDSMSKPEKDIVTISSEEYEKLLSDSKKLPDMISREDFERRLAEAESNFTKARKQAERQAEANAFKDSKLLSSLEKACEQYEITPPFASCLNVKDAKLAFLNAMKKNITSISKLMKMATLTIKLTISVCLYKNLQLTNNW